MRRNAPDIASGELNRGRITESWLLTNEDSLSSGFWIRAWIDMGALAFLLSGAGHGIYAPMVANVSVLAFIRYLAF